MTLGKNSTFHSREQLVLLFHLSVDVLHLKINDPNKNTLMGGQRFVQPGGSLTNKTLY